MAKPLSTMMRTNDVACGARDLPQGAGGSRRMCADALLDQPPRWLDGVEIMRIRREESHRGAARLNQVSDGRRFVRVEVVEQHDVAATQPRRQAGAHPRFEALTGDTTPAHPQREKAIRAH